MYVCMYCMFIYKWYTSVIVQHVLNIGVSKKTEDSHTKRCSMYMEYLLYLYHKLKANDKCTYIPYIMEHLGYRSTWTEMNRTLPSGMLNLQPHDVFFFLVHHAHGAYHLTPLEKSRNLDGMYEILLLKWFIANGTISPGHTFVGI